jgi:cytochrome c-type biogenesis protein CcmH/NrfG
MNGQQIAGTSQGRTTIYQPSNNASISSALRPKSKRFAWPIAEVFIGLVILCAVIGAFKLLQISFTEKLVITNCPHIHTNTTYLGYPAPENMAYGREVAEELAHAIERVPTCANLYWSLGDVQAWLGERTSALESYRRYLQLAGDQAEPSVAKTIQLLDHPQAERIVPLKDSVAVDAVP